MHGLTLRSLNILDTRFPFSLFLDLYEINLPWQYKAFIGSRSYKFIRILFGQKIAPSTFQREMDVIKSTVKWKFALHYLHDIFISSKSILDHVFHLRKVLGLLFWRWTRLSQKRHNARKLVSLDKAAESIHGRDRLTNLTKLKSFLCLCTLFHHFIPNFARI